MSSPISTITGYHAHIYYDPESPEDLAAIQRLRNLMEENFEATFGRWHNIPVGPHPIAMFQVAFPPPIFSKLLPWLMLNGQGRSVLIHPETGNDFEDHTTNALWLGEKLQLKLDFL